MTRTQRIHIGWLYGLILLVPTISIAQSRADCLACHGDSSLTKERNGKQISLFVSEAPLSASPHRKVVCTGCHTGFDPGSIPHKSKIEPVNCLKCHARSPLEHSFHPQLARSIGAHEEPDVGCKDCHGTHDVVSPKVAGSKFSKAHLPQACGECHADVLESFSASSHGLALAGNVHGAPDCISCHRNHITTTEASGDSIAASKIHQEKLCLSCHLDNPEVKARTSPTAGFIAAYESSVHGAALLKGNGKAANCVDCHGSHDMKKGLEASAKVNKTHIPETCAKCHGEIAREFAESVHGSAVAKGNLDAPVCTDCHGEHTILRHTDPKSPVASKNVSREVCSPCHSSVALSTKYGLASDRFSTFSDSYHGLAIRGGAVEVANCASCHGSHGIKASSDSSSTIHKANLAVTCGKCHPGANERFSIGAVHVNEASRGEEPILFWIARTYIVLIIVVIGGMMLHNTIDFIRKSKHKLAQRRGYLDHEVYGHSLYIRMTLSERLQHGALLVSFLTLVITGFMLRFPDTWWVSAIRRLSDNVFEARSIVHRIAAVVMVAASLYHVWYAAFTRRGRELIKDLLPSMQDLRDAVGVMKYNLGFARVKPKFGRFSYVEKSEYWALVWGTLIMALTGVIMWFDNIAIGTFTKLGYDIARQVHYYEAWLATLAIVIWHFYFVMLNPEVYPINLAFWSGTITEEEMSTEHALELEEIKRRELRADLEDTKELPVKNGNDGEPVAKKVKSDG